MKPALCQLPGSHNCEMTSTLWKLCYTAGVGHRLGIYSAKRDEHMAMMKR